MSFLIFSVFTELIKFNGFLVLFPVAVTRVEVVFSESFILFSETWILWSILILTFDASSFLYLQILSLSALLLKLLFLLSFSGSSLNLEASILEFDISFIVSKTVSKWLFNLRLFILWTFSFSEIVFDFFASYIFIFKLLSINSLFEVSLSPRAYVLDFVHILSSSSFFWGFFALFELFFYK